MEREKERKKEKRERREKKHKKQLKKKKVLHSSYSSQYPNFKISFQPFFLQHTNTCSSSYNTYLSSNSQIS
jgi:hypothetical protein